MNIKTLLFKIRHIKNIHYSCTLSNVNQIIINNTVFFGANCILKPRPYSGNGSITCGTNVKIQENAYIIGGNGKVKIGSNVRAGNNLTLLGGGNISIGNNVLISHNVAITSSSHDFNNRHIKVAETKDIFSPVTIKDNVFIGVNATILMGSVIGSGSIIGAGSLVLENTIIGDYEVWAGNPAKQMYTRDKLENKVEKYIHSYLKKNIFHNLFLLFDITKIFASRLGGTCSDRSVRFKKKLKKKFSTNISVKLHRAFINNKKTHTIIRIIINKKVYFIDVGMGYPITKLLPIDKGIEFNSNGIHFKSIVFDNELTLYIIKNNKKKELMRFNTKNQSKKEVKKEIAQRWKNKEQLPFNKSFRYLFIYKNIFYNLKGEIKNINQENL